MRTIALLSSKGGSGKSTLAANLAAAAVVLGERVVLIDTDPQHTLVDWRAARSATKVEPLFGSATAAELPAILDAARRDGRDRVFIDTAGVDSPTNAAVMRAADFALVPARPTVADLRGCLPAVHALIRLGKPFAFVLNQCPPRSSRVSEARAGLAALGIVAEPPIVSRVDYQDALSMGLGVVESNPFSTAAGEIFALLEWIKTK